MKNFKEFLSESIKLSKTEQSIIDELEEYGKYTVNYKSGTDGWGGKIQTEKRIRSALDKLVKRNLIELKYESLMSLNQKNFKGSGMLATYKLKDQ